MADYLHGAYGHLDASVVQQTVTSETVPVYFGTAPVGLVRGYADADVVDSPVRISSLADAQAKIGYSADFGAYTLCEAVAAHFDSGNDGVGPIYVVNVLDPARHAKDSDTSKSVSVVNGRATLKTDTAILDTFAFKRPPVDGTEQASHAHPAISAAMKESGVSYEDGLITYEPTDTISPSLIHDGVPYIGIIFDAPEGATHVEMYMNGKLENEYDLTSDSEFVVGGSPVQWYGFAQADGSPRTETAWDMRFEWTVGGESVETACRVCRYTRDYVEGADYTLDYNASGNSIVLSVIDGRIEDGTHEVTFREMDPDAVTKDDVIGMVTSDGQYSGIAALPLLYQEQFVVPNLLAAPGWSDDPDVYKALVNASSAINGHWDAMVVADLPLVDAEGNMVDTVDKAVQWKADNLYTNERSVACWPMAQDASGRTFHVSTLFVAASQRVDQGHDGIPFESPSNKSVPVARQYFGENSKNRGFDQTVGNTLNSHGITTVIGWAGDWVLWGPHTAAYEHGSTTVDPRAIFAVSMRMLFHITNSFQQEWAPLIDSPMTRQLRDRIINREQEKLDAYVTIGALIGAPRVYFLETENPTSSLMNGDFRWDISVTPTPPLKSASVYVSYTDAGFSAYFDNDGGEQ